MPKKNVNVTLPPELVTKAKDLKLNLSWAAEKGILCEIKKIQEEKWLLAHQAKIQHHNHRINTQGTLLPPSWLTKA